MCSRVAYIQMLVTLLWMIEADQALPTLPELSVQIKKHNSQEIHRAWDTLLPVLQHYRCGSSA